MSFLVFIGVPLTSFFSQILDSLAALPSLFPWSPLCFPVSLSSLHPSPSYSTVSLLSLLPSPFCSPIAFPSLLPSPFSLLSPFLLYYLSPLSASSLPFLAAQRGFIQNFHVSTIPDGCWWAVSGDWDLCCGAGHVSLLFGLEDHFPSLSSGDIYTRDGGSSPQCGFPSMGLMVQMESSAFSPCVTGNLTLIFWVLLLLLEFLTNQTLVSSPLKKNIGCIVKKSSVTGLHCHKLITFNETIRSKICCVALWILVFGLWYLIFNCFPLLQSDRERWAIVSEGLGVG